MNRIFFCICIFTISLSLLSQENYKIKKIIFTGNETIESNLLKDYISVSDLNLYQKIFTKKKPSYFSSQSVKDDIINLRSFYQSNGFLNPKIEYQITKIKKSKKTLFLNFIITENDFIAVDQVNFQSSDSIKVATWNQIIDDLKYQLKLSPNTRFQDNLIKSDKSIIRKCFSNSGYPYAEISYELSLDERNNKVGILWIIKSGSKCFFSETSIKGNNHLNEELIKKQLKFENGDVFSQKLLDDSQSQIFSLGMYYVASVKGTLSKDKKTKIPVEIYLKEAPRLTTKFGVGYGTEDKFRVFSKFQYLSFFGGIRRANLYLKHSDLEPYNVDFSVTQPQFLNPKLTLIVNPYLKKEKEPSYQLKRYGINLPLIYSFKNKISLSSKYYWEKVKLQESVLEEATEQNFDETLYNKSGIILGVTRNTSTPLFSPEKGSLLSFKYQKNGLLYKTEYPFRKLMVDCRLYKKFLGVIIASKIKMGAVEPKDKKGFIPPEDRFYCGGSNSVRGWKRSMLGIKNEDNEPIGGNSLLESSLEIRYPVWKFLSGVLFLDAGNIWEKAYEYDLDDLKYAYGAGLRIKTPIGPIRFDYAIPKDEIEKNAKYHISIGQAF